MERSRAKEQTKQRKKATRQDYVSVVSKEEIRGNVPKPTEKVGRFGAHKNLVVGVVICLFPNRIEFGVRKYSNVSTTRNATD